MLYMFCIWLVLCCDNKVCVVIFCLAIDFVRFFGLFAETITTTSKNSKITKAYQMFNSTPTKSLKESAAPKPSEVHLVDYKIIHLDKVCIIGDHNVIYGANCTIIGNRNTVLGDECSVYGDENIVLSIQCKIRGDRNQIADSRCQVYGTDTLYLAQHSNQRDDTLNVCKQSNTNNLLLSTNNPPEIPADKLGFTDEINSTNNVGFPSDDIAIAEKVGISKTQTNDQKNLLIDHPESQDTGTTSISSSRLAVTNDVDKCHKVDFTDGVGLPDDVGFTDGVGFTDKVGSSDKPFDAQEEDSYSGYINFTPCFKDSNAGETSRGSNSCSELNPGQFASIRTRNELFKTFKKSSYETNKPESSLPTTTDSFAYSRLSENENLQGSISNTSNYTSLVDKSGSVEKIETNTPSASAFWSDTQSSTQSLIARMRQQSIKPHIGSSTQTTSQIATSRAHDAKESGSQLANDTKNCHVKIVKLDNTWTTPLQSVSLPMTKQGVQIGKLRLINFDLTVQDTQEVVHPRDHPEMVCVQCFQYRRQVAFIPCGHEFLCLDCLRKVISEKPTDKSGSTDKVGSVDNLSESTLAKGIKCWYCETECTAMLRVF